MNIRPLNDRILIRRKDDENVSPGGILLPTKAQERSNQGEVLAVGKGKILDTGEILPLSVKVGDQVIFGQYSGSKVKIDGEDLIILAEPEVFGILES